MKKNILILILLPLALLWSCNKNELLKVDMSQYNTDTAEPNEVDIWLKETFQKVYNIEVLYRFNRNLTEVARDVAPPKLDRVKPMMEAVLNCYIKPYERVAGVKFIKTYCPKQYVLFGSVLYNSNNSVVLGTADAGRQVTLYDVNNFNVYDVNSDNGVKRKLRTIHHEFTHILNQNVIIPTEFVEVTKADYYSDWTNSQNTETVAKSLGFVSRYARMVYTEDFAEMAAHLLVMGQGWFDSYVASAPADAQTKLKRKEEIVVKYFNTAFGIDFRALQKEIMLEFNKYLNLSAMIDLNKINRITFIPSAPHYTEYGISDDFNTMWTNYKNGMSEQMPTGNRRYPQDMYLSFVSNKKMTIYVNYLNNAQTSTLQAAYDFDIDVDVPSGEITIVKSAEEGTTTAHNNGKNFAFVKSYFDDYMYPYFHNKVFVAAWLPEQIQASDPLYGMYGGIYEKGNPTNYFYGPIQYK